MGFRDRFKRQSEPAATPPTLAPGQQMVTFEGLGMH